MMRTFCKLDLQWPLVLLTFSSHALAIQFVNNAASLSGITAGRQFLVIWSGAVGSVTLTLKTGSASDLETVETIGANLTGLSYFWDVPNTLPTGAYELEIEDSTNLPAYSSQFQLSGGVSSISSASATSTTSSAMTSSSQTSTSPTSIQAASSSDTTHGLSTGARIGIGVGVAVGGILIIAIIAFLFYRQGRRNAIEKQKTSETSKTSEISNDFADKAQLGAGEMGEEISPLAVEQKMELERKRRAVELEGMELSKGPVEADGIERVEADTGMQGKPVFEMG